MAALSWTLPEKGTPAQKVRGGLDRFQTELEEWTAEIRKRPEWGMPAEEAADFQVYEKALEEVADLLGLRAVAAAAAGRDGAEILRDLESVSLLSRHLWNRIGTVNRLLWEVLATRHLKDVELQDAGALLLDEPPFPLLLRQPIGKVWPTLRDSWPTAGTAGSRRSAGQPIGGRWIWSAPLSPGKHGGGSG
ncbi:MAG: hypothetical protein JWM59_54 [Verrucomicrobiales bacterium]|nr:hypothetical protein [Verrucomicrobiales bacterium]